MQGELITPLAYYFKHNFIMKILDYTGLSRLAANLLSYVSSKVDPLEQTAPFYVPRVCLYQGLEPIVSERGGTQFNDLPSEFNENSVGTVAAALYKRFCKGVPSALIIRTTLFEAAEDLELKNSSSRSTDETFYIESFGTFGNQYTVIYRGSMSVNGESLRIIINKDRTLNFTLETERVEVTAEEEEGDTTTSGSSGSVVNEELLPLKWTLNSIAADGSIIGGDLIRIVPATENEAKIAIRERLLKCMPPAILLDLEYADGSIHTTCLYQSELQRDGSYYYASPLLGNGNYTNKQVLIAMKINNPNVPTNTTIQIKILFADYSS